jgi:membrane-associated phospholipid phosphatase
LLSQDSLADKIKAGVRPLDKAIIGYVIFELAIVFLFLRGNPGWFFFIAFYALIGAIAMFISSTEFSGFWKIIRLAYPLLIAPLMYELLQFQIFAIHKHSFDSQINNLEMSVLGFDSSFAFQRIMTPVLNEIMSISYISYYILSLGLVISMVVLRRWRSLERAILGASLAFFVSYILFLLYPVAGPRFYLNNIYYLPMTGPFFTPLAQNIVMRGGLQGGAMPSSHCAVALVLIYFMIKEWPRLIMPLITLLILICFSTIYGRYHYVSDVVAGLVLGAMAIIIATNWQSRFFSSLENNAIIPEAATKSTEEVGIED